MASILLQIIVGWFTIDLVTGLYHAALDHSRLAKRLLPGQARDFATHHDNAQSMARVGFVSRNWLPALFSLPALIFAWFGAPAFWLTVWLGGTLSQQAHYWSHHERPAFVYLLQRIGILISPAAHYRHHLGFDRCYGVLSGWSHGTLDVLLCLAAGRLRLTDFAHGLMAGAALAAIGFWQLQPPLVRWALATACRHLLNLLGIG